MATRIIPGQTFIRNDRPWVGSSIVPPMVTPPVGSRVRVSDQTIDNTACFDYNGRFEGAIAIDSWSQYFTPTAE